MDITDTPARTVRVSLAMATDHADLSQESAARAAWTDDGSDELMANESPDGRPPTQPARSLAWYAAAVVGPALACLLVLWLVVRDTHGRDMLWLCAAFLLVAPLSAWPLLAAVAMRGREASAARRAAHLAVAAASTSPRPTR